MIDVLIKLERTGRENSLANKLDDDDKTSLNHARMRQLCEAASPGPVLILTHDNPDPDALASGKALATLLQAFWNIQSHLVYSGTVARADNRSMLKYLTPEWEHHDTLKDLNKYSSLALVDTQPGDRKTIQYFYSLHYALCA